MQQELDLAPAVGTWARLVGALSCWCARQRHLRHSDGRDNRVRIEDLSPHILRDLGISTQDARDFAAQERARFLD